MSKPADDWATLNAVKMIAKEAGIFATEERARRRQLEQAKHEAEGLGGGRKDPADDFPPALEKALADYMHSHRDATVKYWQGRWQDEARRVHKLSWALLIAALVGMSLTVWLFSLLNR